jgi:hypothetical protein
MQGAFQAWSVSGSRAGIASAVSTGYPTESRHDGTNAVYFASAAGRQVDYGIIALTEVLYWVSSGQIAEADMVFNDNIFFFTSNEGDTGRRINGRTAIYLRDVATHEAGHALGLDHSMVNLSSLVYTAFSGQFTLGEDDQSAVRTIFPSGGGGGALTGEVRGTNGGIFGAHVTAVDLATGRVTAGTLANSDGTFRLGDLPAGKYAVMMEPFGADVSSVSAYYRNVSHRFCSGSRFRRGFYGPCGAGGAASVLELGAGQTLNLGTLAPSCAQMGNPGGAPLSLATAKTIDGDGAAAFGTLRPGESHYYRVRVGEGRLDARALSYSLYSPVDVKVEFLNAIGTPIGGAQSVDNVQNPMPGGYVNYDSAARVQSPPGGGDFVIRVSAAAQRLPSSYYPAGFELLDGDGHYLLAFSVDGDIPATGASDMSGCVSVQNDRQSAWFRAPAGDDSGDDNAAGCASLGTGSGPFTGGLGLVFLFATLVQLCLRGKRRFRALVPTRR